MLSMEEQIIDATTAEGQEKMKALEALEKEKNRGEGTDKAKDAAARTEASRRGRTETGATSDPE